MIHGPYRPQVTYSPCMIDGTYSKFYPKQFTKYTTILKNGFNQYAHRDNGLSVQKMGSR
jgi:hypothetical protein